MFTSDIKLISEKLQNFQLEYVFIIIPIVTFSFFIRGFRWMLFLKYLKINIGIKNSFGIYFAGMALMVTPGGSGELIKNHILKEKFGHSYTKTIPVLLTEKYHNMLSVIPILFIYYIFYLQAQVFGVDLYRYIASFFLFRFLDSFKPFAIGYFDKNYKNSFGILFDDVLAGIYTLIVLLLLIKFF